MTQVRYVVVDEADRMIEKGHFHELSELFQLINTNEYVYFHSLFNGVVLVASDTKWQLLRRWSKVYVVSCHERSHVL